MHNNTPVVMGVDPGSIHTGYGVISQKGSRLIYLDSGCISPPKNITFEQRLLFIYDGLRKVIQNTPVNALSVESIFYAKNVKSALLLAHARSLALLLAAQHQLPLFEYSPLEVKMACTGYGRATKQQVASMISHLFPKYAVQKKNSLDESDALSVALCHLNSWTSKQKMIPKKQNQTNPLAQL